MDRKRRHIELLAPARTADIGIEAVRHGADAVYIGAEDFGARAAAGNSVGDIGRLCDFAHRYGARVYVTLNTILYDGELAAAERLVRELYAVGADALIVQDMGLLRLDLPPIALHASTQMDITTPEKALFLHRCGFEQIVLARELSLRQIGEIAGLVPARLEAFVHGALCVSYSGRCYASEACMGRSANRGRCAQFCRLAFDLEDAEGRVLVRGKHLLSLRDLNRAAHVEEMMDAGVSSFKIEGRLKGMDYVKNVTAYYRRAIDEVLRTRDEYVRSSWGETALDFEPRLEKSFNRGFTTYFLKGRTPVHNFDSPKAWGERVGQVTSQRGRRIELDAEVELHAGDGLCYVGAGGEMEGLRVNSVEDGAIVAARDVRIPIGTEVFRNLDYAFTHRLERPSAERRMGIDVSLEERRDGYALRLEDEAGRRATLDVRAEKMEARTPQRENIVRILGRLGDTPYVLRNVRIDLEGERFIPASALTEWRRLAVEKILSERPRNLKEGNSGGRTEEVPDGSELTEIKNVSNALAREVYEAAGVKNAETAFEITHAKDTVLMTCRHCLRYALGRCQKYRRGSEPLPADLALRLPDGRRFPLVFDCKRCEMMVLQDEKEEDV